MDAYRSDDRPDLTRRAALAGAAALGGAGIASMVGAEKALAATSEYFVNAIDYGVVGNGVANDTTALQNAINAAIAADKPLYLPPGRFRTTAGLVAETPNFGIFGAGPRLSVIVPDASGYDALTIGPGGEGSGNGPSGFARDFGLEGGNAEWDAPGIEPDTGTAAFKLLGMRQFQVMNIDIASDSSFDIGFDLTGNSHACTFYNCRTGLNGCRVGVNIRDGGGGGTGSDVTFFNSWLFGEVAAVFIGNDGGGYHFYGGQFTSSWQAASPEDGRGSLILGRQYLEPAAKGRAATCTFDGIDFEGQQRCWIIRAYDEISITVKDCQLNGSGENASIGVIKSSAFENGRLQLINNRITGDFTKKAEELMLLEGGFSGRQVFEVSASGQCIANSVEVNLDDAPLSVFSKQEWGFSFGPEAMSLNGMLLRYGPLGTLDLSKDWGTSWRIASPEGDTIASASTLTVPDGLALAKITGTTEIKTINATGDGHLLVLKFAASLKVTDGSNLKLRNNESFNATADDTLTLVCDGTNWFEVGRSAN